MGTSFYKGDQSKRISPTPKTQTNTAMQLFIGHVLEVFYEDPTPGRIRVKIISVDKKQDDIVTRTALPADLNVIKYPLPGELVLMFNGLGSSTIKDRIASQLYYVTTLSADNSVTINSNPYFSGIETTKTADEVFDEQHEIRFESELSNYPSFKNLQLYTSKNKLKIKPVEGDTIIQGRFGASIRLGSSGDSKTGVGWKNPTERTGDPIVIFSVNKQTGDLTRVENVNLDESSIFICSSQVIPVVLSCSKDLKTHKFLGKRFKKE